MSPTHPTVPELRTQELNPEPIRQDGDHVLYWMVASRRPGWNFGLQRAAELCRELGRGLLILEALRLDYPWASQRLHAFVLEGMADNQRAFARRRVTYHPYVEPRPGAGKGLLETLARRAAVVVTDLWPCFFLPRMQQALAERVDVRVEAVDSCGILPLAAGPRAFARAVDFRRHLQRTLPDHLDALPRADALGGSRLPDPPEIPRGVQRRWPATSPELLSRQGALELPLDASVAPVDTTGGSRAARRALRRFLDARLAAYDEERNHPDAEATSELSPYLHFGHLSPHQVLVELAETEGWNPGRLGERASGAREGWWGMSPSAEAFLDQLVTWRELSFNTSYHVEAPERYETLPGWARATLEAHERDPRPAHYSLEELAAAATDDPIWNAAQRELLQEGTLHTYLRMLWGKRILEWTPTAREALAVMTELNNRLALDGRDPNSISGIAWVLGRYDRPWPESPIFGKVRRMTSASTRRKLRLRGYLERYGA